MYLLMYIVVRYISCSMCMYWNVLAVNQCGWLISRSAGGGPWLEQKYEEMRVEGVRDLRSECFRDSANFVSYFRFSLSL